MNLTTASDLTAIYNCSAFFAYAFSIPMLHERIRSGKVFSVIVATVGVLIVAYGDRITPKHGSKSGGGSHKPTDPSAEEASNRALGNIIIGIGSVLYGFYEVLYKRVACPPDGCSAGRGVLFAMTFGSFIGTFTVFVLWIALPILHWTGIEEFVWPTGKTALYLFISIFSNTSTFFINSLGLHFRHLANTPHSLLGIFSHSHLINITGTLFCCCIAHHLHCRGPRPDPSSTTLFASLWRRHPRRSSHCLCIYSTLLEYLERNGGRAEGQSHGR